MPRSRDGSDAPENLALTCISCNSSKYNHITGTDPLDGTEQQLFNPRVDTWDDHFRWSGDGVTLEGRTPIGRATVNRLKMNSAERLEARRYWVRLGLLP